MMQGGSREWMQEGPSGAKGWMRGGQHTHLLTCCRGPGTGALQAAREEEQDEKLSTAETHRSLRPVSSSMAKMGVRSSIPLLAGVEDLTVAWPSNGELSASAPTAFTYLAPSSHPPHPAAVRASPCQVTRGDVTGFLPCPDHIPVPRVLPDSWKPAWLERCHQNTE